MRSSLSLSPTKIVYVERDTEFAKRVKGTLLHYRLGARFLNFRL